MQAWGTENRYNIEALQVDLLYDVWRDIQGREGNEDKVIKKWGNTASASNMHIQAGTCYFYFDLSFSSAVMLGNQETSSVRLGRSPSTFNPPPPKKNPRKHKCEQPEAAAVASHTFNYSAESLSSGHVKALLARRGGGISTGASTERPLRQDAVAWTDGEHQGAGTGGRRQEGVNRIKGKDKHITASPLAASGIMNSLITAEGVIHLWNQRQIEMRKTSFWSISCPSVAGKLSSGVPLKRLGATLSCRHRYSVSGKLPPHSRHPTPNARTREAGQSTRWVHQYSTQRRPDKQWLAHQVKMSDSQSSPAAAGVKCFCWVPHGRPRKECVESNLHLRPPPPPQLSLPPPILVSPSSSSTSSVILLSQPPVPFSTAVLHQGFPNFSSPCCPPRPH